MDETSLTFGLTDEQKMMRESVRGLLARVHPEARVDALDRAREFPHEAWRALCQAGFAALPYPVEYGGTGGSFTDLAVLTEALAAHDNGIAVAFLNTVIYAGMHIALHGSEELKRTHLPRIVSGDSIMGLCMTEPWTGSDAAGMKTRAVRDGDDYILTGEKIYNTNIHVSDHTVVVCRTDPNAERYAGLSLLLVDTKSPGVSVQTIDALGRHANMASHSFFDEVRVPASNLIGRENNGWRDMMECLNVERLCLAATGVGCMERIIGHVKQYALGREQFGRPISKFQAIAHKFADMEIMWQTARAQTYRVADMIDAGLDPVGETSVAKAYATESAWKCADMGMQIMAGAGYIMDSTMQRLFRDTRAGTIGGGTSEIQRNVIARQMGL